MTRNVNLLITAFMCTLPVFGQEPVSTNDNQVLVTWGDSPSDPFVHSYHFARSQLPGKVSWDPGKPFPVDLGSEAVRAKAFLATRLQTNDFKLQWISIAPSPFVSEWLLHFHLCPDPPFPTMTNLNVIMLLDGTYAEERLQPKSHSEILFEGQTAHERLKEKNPPRQISVMSGTNILSQTQRRVTKTNALDLVGLPDFVIPSVQWKWGEPFPIDLSAGVAQAQACLNHSERFVLREIDVSRYLPDGAMGNSANAFLNNLDHWLIEYYFNSSEEKAAYRVYMLLDRRILCVASQDY